MTVVAHQEFKDNLEFVSFLKELPVCKKENKTLRFSTRVLRGKDNGLLKKEIAPLFEGKEQRCTVGSVSTESVRKSINSRRAAEPNMEEKTSNESCMVYPKMW